MKTILYTIFLLCCFSTMTLAQGSKLERAADLMNDLNYTEAIKIYNEILKENDNAEAKMNIAEAYRLTNDVSNAEYWFGQVVRLPQSKSIHKLYYAQMLQINGKCDQAKEWFSAFASEQPGDHRGQLLLKSCDEKQELMTKNQGLFEVNNLSINTASDDFGASFYDDGIIFSSDRDKGTAVKRIHTWTGDSFLELFYAEVEVESAEEGASMSCDDYKIGTPSKFNKDVNTKFHDAQVSVSRDNQKIVFTRNNLLDGKVGKSNDDIIKLKVYEADKVGEDWDNIRSLPFNSDEYSVTHPALSPDGDRLFFASDMPGGFGGLDIYVSTNENGRWGPPFNLGPLINTEGNELFPFYGNDNNLYFSSNGQIGLGGLDVYVVEDRDNNQWGDVINLGYPINSTYDDFAISFKKDMSSGFISSNRSEGKGRDDIYCFVKKASPAEIYVYDMATGEPLEGAQVVNECNFREYTTDENGLIMLDIANDTCCTFKAVREMYDDKAERYCTINNQNNRIEIGLERSFECYVKGHVFDQTTGMPIEGARVSVDNDCDKSNPLEVITDAEGFYRLDLKSTCCYTVMSEKEDYIMNPMQEKCTDCKTEATELVVDIFMNPSTISANTVTPGTGTNNPDDNGNPFGSTGSDDVLVSSGSDDVSAPNSSQIVKDVDTGLYIDRATGEPANVQNEDGISYVDGKMMYKGREVEADNNDDFGFEVSPGAENYSEGEPVPYLLHIYYDFDESFIRKEAEPELQKLCEMMRQNPQLIVELSSHTDPRGTLDYNMRLSQRRADAAVRWMVEKCGIARHRLIPRGYGETEPINECLAAKSRCSEEDHQFNRRTEFRILGCIGEVQTKYSQPKANPRVDPCPNCSF